MSIDRIGIGAAIDPLLIRRWSPRAFAADRTIERHQLEPLLEAARWAPSCFNEQPWRYLVCVRDEDPAAWNDALDCLVPGNRKWARNAPVLMASLAHGEFAKNGKANRWARHDTGAASMALVLQAAALGLVAHQMGGFDGEKLRATFAIPSHLEPLAMIAVGHPGSPDVLEPDTRARELEPRTRREIDRTVFFGRSRPPS